MSLLAAKRVLVTGASSGIGAAAAEAFAREGADVILLARSVEGLETVAERVRAHGRRAHVAPADVADRPVLEAAIDGAVDALGGLDVLVVNAAAMVLGPFAQVPAEDFDRTFAITFTGAVNTVRTALPHLERSGGTIVATGSIGSRIPLPTFSAYAAAKHALRGFLGSLRIELRQAGSPVSVCMVHPGLVNTPLWTRMSSATGRQPRLLPDAYTPETVAEALVACAARPRAEVTVGLEARAGELGFALARPLADRVLVGVARWYGSGDEPAPPPGTLWAPSGRGETAGKGRGRPSLWRALRVRG